MNIFLSNLVAATDKNPNWPEFLLDVLAPFNKKIGIEFFIHTCSETYMEQMEHAAQWTQGLPLAFHGPFLTVEASSKPQTAEYNWFIQSYIAAFKLVNKLGGSHLVFHDHECFVKPDEKDRLQCQCLNNIHLLEDLAEPYGIRLLLENLALPSKGTPLFDQEEYLQLFDRFPRSDCLIDTGHLAAAHWDMEKVIASLKGKVKAYHLHNNDGTADSHCRIRDGIISYEDFFRLYRTYTPNADLTLEYTSDHGIIAAEIADDLNYVLQELKK